MSPPLQKKMEMAPRDHNIYYPETYFTSLTAITSSVHSDDSVHLTAKKLGYEGGDLKKPLSNSGVHLVGTKYTYTSS